MTQLFDKINKLLIKMRDDFHIIDFESSIENVFKDSGFEVRTEGTLDIPYFNGKDICRVLGFKDNIKNTLKNVPDYYKKSLKVMNQNEGKSIYLTEGGMYYLIFQSQTQKAKDFVIFLNTILLPSILKREQQVLLDELEIKDKIDKILDYVKDIKNQKYQIEKKLEKLKKKKEKLEMKYEKLKNQIILY